MANKSPMMENTSYDQLRSECQDLKARGYFNLAQKKLTELSQTQSEKGAELIIETADTLCLQGLYTLAFERLDNYVTGCAKSEPITNNAIHMMRAFSRAHAQGIFQDGLILADSYNGMRNYGHESEEVAASQYRWNFWYFALKMGLVDASSKPSLDKSTLKTAFLDMMGLGKYAMAGKIAGISIFGGDSAASIDLFRHLAFNDDVSPVVKAKALAWLAGMHNDRGEKGESRQLFRKARSELKNIDHGYASAELDLQEAHNEYTGEISQIEDVVGQYVKVCSDLLWYHGLIESVDRLRELVDKDGFVPVSLQMSALIEGYAEMSGAHLLRNKARLDCVDAWNKLSDHNGNAINIALEVYESLETSDCFPLRQRAAALAAKNYAKLKDCERAATWAHKSVEESRKCSKLKQSEAALTFIECNFLTVTGSDDAQQKYLATMDFVRAEIENGNQEIALSMLDVLRITLASTQKMFDVDCSGYLPEVISCIQSLQNQLSSEADQGVSPLMLHAQAIEIYQQSKRSPGISKEEEAIALVRLARQKRLEAKQLYEVAMLHGLQGKIYHGIVAKFRPTDKYTDIDLVRKYLALAMQQYSLALGYFEIFSDTASIARYKQYEAQVLYEMWGIGDTSAIEVLDKVRDAQVRSDQIRGELTALGGLNAIENKRRVQAISTTNSGYLIASHVTTHENMAVGAWEWIQRAKARSLSDFLGSEDLVPKELLAQIAADEEALEIYEHVRQHVENMKESGSLSMMSNQLEMDEYLAKMRQNPLLKTLVDLREGAPLPLSDLQQELHYLKRSTEGRDIVLVDWLFRDEEIWMLTVKEIGEPILEKLSITVTAVKEWTKLHLQSSPEHEPCIMADDRNEDHPMHELAPLIQPLISNTQAEDILVLSPTGILHSLPLHALTIIHDDTPIPLIERHPIVYAASMTTFIQCCRRARDNSSPDDLTKSFLDAYEDFSGYDFRPTEQAQVRDLMAELAHETSGEFHHGQGVVWDEFCAIAERSRMLLFHGHCDLEAEDIKSQGLRLPVRESDGSVLFPVPSFFDLNLRHAPHITLMACASTVQAITTGDEPLGLVTALLCAGAASVLGTMWPVASSTARVFARNFIANWRTSKLNMSADGRDDSKSQRDTGGDWLNLALALRETVLDLREGVRTKEVVHWGGFVLHGSFFCRCDGHVPGSVESPV